MKKARLALVAVVAGSMIFVVADPGDALIPVTVLASTNWIYQDAQEANTALNTLNSYKQLATEVTDAGTELEHASKYLDFTSDMKNFSNAYGSFSAQNPSTASLNLAQSMLNGTDGMLTASDIQNVQTQIDGADGDLAEETADGEATTTATTAIYQGNIFQAAQAANRSDDIVNADFHRMVLLDLAQYNYYSASFNDYSTNFKL